MILSSGSTNPTVDHFGSDFLPSVNGDEFMSHCWLAVTSPLVRSGAGPTDVDYSSFTYRYDHHVDYPCLSLFRPDQRAALGRPLLVRGLAFAQRIRLPHRNGRSIGMRSVRPDRGIPFSGAPTQKRAAAPWISRSVGMCYDHDDERVRRGVAIGQLGPNALPRWRRERDS